MSVHQPVGFTVRGWLRIAGAALFAAAGLSACGGGGGDGPRTSLSLSTHQISVSATTDDVAPTALFEATVSNPPQAGLYAGYTNTARGVASIDIVGVSDTTASVTLSFRPPTAMGVGVHTDTIAIHVCFDDVCGRPVDNSPQTLSVVYTVTAGHGNPPGSPVLASLSPPSALAGSPSFQLTVNGTGFVPQSIVLWNGVARPTHYDSPTQLTADIAAGDIAVAGAVPVAVSNAAVGSGVSAAVDFSVMPPAALSLTRVSPTRVATGAPGFVITAIGTGFNTSSIVQWNGAARPTTFVSSTVLTAQIAAADIATTGTNAVTVLNAGGLGTVSAAMSVVVAIPTIDAVAMQIDPAHTGTVHFNSPTLPSTSLWHVDLGGAPSYALIASGKVFVTVTLTGGASELVALDQATGATVWGPILLQGQAAAAYDSGTVFIVSSVIGNAALMQAYDATNGHLNWSTLLSGQYMFSSPPTAANGHVYTGGAGSGGTLYAVDQGTGAMAWTRPVANGDASAPAVTADGVYVTYPCTTYDFRPATGEAAWTNNTGCSGGGGATPVVANGVLYSPNSAGGSYSGSTFNAATGQLLGAYVADNLPAIGAQSGYFLQGGTLRGITLSSNAVQWSFAGDGQLVTSPIVVNQYVFVGSGSGHLYGLDANTGQQQWVQDLGAPIPAGAGWGARMPITGLSAGDGLLVAPAGNTLTAFRLSSAP
jgi:outer membrane protein assembly factor BamB